VLVSDSYQLCDRLLIQQQYTVIVEVTNPGRTQNNTWTSWEVFLKLCCS